MVVLPLTESLGDRLESEAEPRSRTAGTPNIVLVLDWMLTI